MPAMGDPRMPTAPSPVGPAQGDPNRQTSDYQNMVDQWSQMPVPNPAGLLKLLMTPGFLTKHQLDAIKALMTPPGQPPAGTTQAQPAAAPNPLGGPTA